MKYTLDFKPVIHDSNSEVYPVVIYQIIRQCSNADNKLTIKDIMDTFSDYWQGDKNIESYTKNLQRTIKRNLIWVLGMDSNIKALKKDDEPYDVLSGESPLKIKKIWYDHKLSLTDLQLLTDAVISSKHFSNEKRRVILRNLLHAIGETPATKTAWFQNVLQDAGDITELPSEDLYSNLESINEAIENKTCLSFNYCFYGPARQNYVVKTFSGVSPYKIIYDNGTYYLAASRRGETPLPHLDDHVDPKDIITIEINKLTGLQPDLENEYYPLEETKGSGKTVKEFLSTSVFPHPVKTSRIMFYFFNNNKAVLMANAEGLDILIEKYGKGISVSEISNSSTHFNGIAPELQCVYKVNLKEINYINWLELALLCSRNPRSIKIIEPATLIDDVIYIFEANKSEQPDF